MTLDEIVKLQKEVDNEINAVVEYAKSQPRPELAGILDEVYA